MLLALSHSQLIQGSPLRGHSVNLCFPSFLSSQQLPRAVVGEEWIPQIPEELQDSEQQDDASAELCLGGRLNLPSTSENQGILFQLG